MILSSADLDLIKMFDRNKDGVLEPEELEMAQVAFRVLDPEAQAGATGGDDYGYEGAGFPPSSSSSSSATGYGAGAAAPVPSGYGAGGSNYGSRRPSNQAPGGLGMTGNAVLPGTGAAYLGRR